MNPFPPCIWPIGSVEQEPHTSLMNWRVFQVLLRDSSSPTLHLVGYAIEVREGRVSSAIDEVDVQRMVVKTSSGRLYELCGDSSYDGRAEFVWREWLGRSGAKILSEVTDALSELARLHPPRQNEQ